MPVLNQPRDITAARGAVSIAGLAEGPVIALNHLAVLRQITLQLQELPSQLGLQVAPHTLNQPLAFLKFRLGRGFRIRSIRGVLRLLVLLRGVLSRAGICRLGRCLVVVLRRRWRGGLSRPRLALRRVRRRPGDRAR